MHVAIKKDWNCSLGSAHLGQINASAVSLRHVLNSERPSQMSQRRDGNATFYPDHPEPGNALSLKLPWSSDQPVAASRWRNEHSWGKDTAPQRKPNTAQRFSNVTLCILLLGLKNSRLLTCPLKRGGLWFSGCLGLGGGGAWKRAPGLQWH